MAQLSKHAGITILVATALLTAGAVQAGARRIKVSSSGTSTDVTTSTTTTTTSSATTTSTTTSTSEYLSSLVGGYTPSPIAWGGRNWRVNAGSTWNANMDYSLRLGAMGRKIRFELRNTTYDRPSGDSTDKRRAEASGSIYGDPTRLPNGVPLWGAMSFKHQSWADPVGMSKLTGGVYGQVHMGSSFGGSPAVAFRRTKTGAFRITTRGEYDTAGTTRYEAPLTFDQPHRLVWRMVLDPTAGSLQVWLDGVKVVDVPKASIGSHYAESYFAFGLYFSGGITCPVVAEYANMVYPGTNSLADQTSYWPTWPTG